MNQQFKKSIVVKLALLALIGTTASIPKPATAAIEDWALKFAVMGAKQLADYVGFDKDKAKGEAINWIKGDLPSAAKGPFRGVTISSSGGFFGIGSKVHGDFLSIFPRTGMGEKVLTALTSRKKTYWKLEYLDDNANVKGDRKEGDLKVKIGMVKDKKVVGMVLFDGPVPVMTLLVPFDQVVNGSFTVDKKTKIGDYDALSINDQGIYKSVGKVKLITKSKRLEQPELETMIGK